MFKKEKIMTLNVITVLTAISAIAASTAGIILPGIYTPIVANEEIPFVFAQDLISLIASILILIITFSWKKNTLKPYIIRTGLAGYLFYVYGQYAMGTVYNRFYFLYLLTFSLSIFYLIIAFAAVEHEKITLSLPKPIRIIIAVYCAAIPVFFAPQWIIEIIRNIQTNSRPGALALTFNHYVYILDLCLILPACVIASVLLFKKKAQGILLGGIISVFGFVLMLWVALGFFFQPLFHLKPDITGTVTFIIITFIFLVLSVFYFIHIKITRTEG